MLQNSSSAIDDRKAGLVDRPTTRDKGGFHLFFDRDLQRPTPYSENGNYFAKAKDRMDRSFGLIRSKVKDASVVDIGASPFYLLYKCRELGARECHGIYFSNDNHPLKGVDKIYSTFGPIELYHSNIELEPLPFPDASVDIVTACEIIEHVDYFPFHFANEVRRVLRPGGTICITVPNVASVAHIIKLIFQKNIYMRYRSDASGRHKHEYTLPQLKALVEWMGFQVTASGVMPSPTSDKWWLRPMYRALAKTPLIWRYSPVLYVVGSLTDRTKPLGNPPAILYDDAQSIED